MKNTFILAVIVLVIALALPLLASGARGAAVPDGRPEADGRPGQSEAADASSASADADTRFTVLSDGVVQRVSMAEWLPGVLGAEMPAGFASEALKAQAVAARSYILSRCAVSTAAHPGADVCDDPDCCKGHLSADELREKWGASYDDYRAKMDDAVRATDGETLTYNGTAIQALFHSSSAGMTEDAGALWGDLPYLVSVTSPETGADVPNYVSTVEVSVTDFAATLREGGFTPDLSGTPDTWVGALGTGLSGRVHSAEIGGVSIPGAELRTLFSLRSTAFTLDYINGAFLFTVTGYGHGVGMSQYGANVMARDGADYRAILAHYYPGTVLAG